MGGAVLGSEASGISLVGLVLGAVLGAEGPGLFLVGPGTVVGRWEKLSAGPECQCYDSWILH